MTAPGSVRHIERSYALANAEAERLEALARDARRRADRLQLDIMRPLERPAADGRPEFCQPLKGHGAYPTRVEAANDGEDRHA